MSTTVLTQKQQADHKLEVAIVIISVVVKAVQEGARFEHGLEEHCDPESGPSENGVEIERGWTARFGDSEVTVAADANWEPCHIAVVQPEWPWSATLRGGRWTIDNPCDLGVPL